jgi:hypothetical protein
MFYYLYKKYRQRQTGQTPTNESKTPNNDALKTEKQKKGAQCQHVRETPNGKCEICAAEKSAARRYRWKLLLLLLPGFFVASLDLTIVATALPFIASHFGMFVEIVCTSQY